MEPRQRGTTARAIGVKRRVYPPARLDNADLSGGRSSSHSRFGLMRRVLRVGNSDRTSISEWKPPLAPSIPSTHDEEAQLEALKKHMSVLMQELQEHNELRGPMMALVRALQSSPWPYLFTLFFYWLACDTLLYFYSSTLRARRSRQRLSVTGTKIAVFARRTRQIWVLRRFAAGGGDVTFQEARRESARARSACWRRQSGQFIWQGQAQGSRETEDYPRERRIDTGPRQFVAVLDGAASARACAGGCW